MNTHHDVQGEITKTASQIVTLPEAVNYHLNKSCNFRCRGCYAVFNDEPTSYGVMLPREKMFDVVSAVAAAPLPEGKTLRKLTFAGGEPTLCPWLPELIVHAKSLGLVTMLVTNGLRCTREYLSRIAPVLDWLTLSVDSLVPQTNIVIGRCDGHGKPIDSSTYAAILADAQELGIHTKVNTVVNSVNQLEDLSRFLARSGIVRWKILQVMAVAGQNDEHISELAVSRAAFDLFVARHAGLSANGIRIVPEPVESIRGSYAMIDRFGRFFDSASGAHRYSNSILEVGVIPAFSQISFDHHGFIERGGSYDFEAKPQGGPSGISTHLQHNLSLHRLFNSTQKRAMNKPNRHQAQPASEVHPRYCAHCGFAFPALQRAQQAQYRFCPGCRNPVQWGTQQWANIRVDDQGVIYSDESSPGFLSVEKPKSRCMEFLARTPGGIVISGIALGTLGYGFVLAAVPLATAGAAIAAAGAAVIQTAVIGGVIMGLIVAFAGEGEGIGGVLMLSGVVAVGGGAMVLAGALTIALAGIAGVLGTILIALGVVAVGAVGCHQLFLQNQKHGWTRKAQEAIAGKSRVQESHAETKSLGEVEDPWTGIDKLSLEANILNALRNRKNN